MVDVAIDIGRVGISDTFETLRKKFDALPGMMNEQVIGDGLNAAARVIVREARIPHSRFRDRSGLLRASIRARRTSTRLEFGTRVSGTGARVIFGGRIRRGGGADFIVAARNSARGRRAYHAHLVEFGHQGGYRKLKNGTRVFVNTAARPHPFVRHAAEGTISRQLLAAEKAMEKSLVKMARNLKNNKLTTRQRAASLVR